ncbi:MAG: WYL domain-containing protein [Opitutaceae bacterium]|nr:WYL domain-containing protein [Opitutaceae bacterium]
MKTRTGRKRAPKERQRALPWSRRQRLRHLEALAYWRGSFRRSDLLNRFDIGMQRVSDDIREYMRQNPGALEYDRHGKLYRATAAMKPIFGEPELHEALGLLGPRSAEAGPWFDRVTLPVRQISPIVLQSLFRAVATQRSIHVRYASLHSATHRWRWITPHAFADDGYRWHVRAFCHEESTFKDFVIGRISSAADLGEPAAKPQDDKDWNAVSSFCLRVAPGLSKAEVRALQLDFGLKESQMVVPIRSALALYALAQLGLEESGRPKRRRFVLA